MPASNRFHGSDSLTYSSKKAYAAGQIVNITLKERPVLGVVIKACPKPGFKVKSIGAAQDQISMPEKSLELMKWLKIYYPAGAGAITSQFLPKNLLLKKVKFQNEPPKSAPLLKLPHLTINQKEITMQIEKKASQSYLLHGETGSGKTRIYQELAKSSLSAGKSVLILAPEIALTAQLINSFKESFNSPVVVLHSALSGVDRRRAWLDIYEASQPVIVIGPRSALFSPFRNLGLIVVDEAHETAYKQDQAPYYYALRVAAKLAELHHSQLIFGTATPNVSEYYLAHAKGVPILRLQGQALKDVHPTATRMVDAKDRTNFKRDINLSEALLEALDQTLKNGEQALIFLNRRGTARIIRCSNGDWQSLCPNCDLPLTYHGDNHNMRCHTCGHKQAVPSSCPVCGSSDIIFRSIGTKSIVASLQRLFPKAKIARFDTDNLPSERFERHYRAVASGDIDVLVGTQILAKGLDLPKLSLVGVVAAESSLYFPDYTAEERTYQLLSQVVGRVGRGHRSGTAVIQSYDPKSLVIKSALSKDWETFYDQQIKERQAFGFPPFYHLLKLSCRRKTKAGAIRASQDLHAKLIKLGLRVNIIGPSPSFHEKVSGNYQWQLIVKAKHRGELLKIISNLPASWSYNIDPINLL